MSTAAEPITFIPSKRRKLQQFRRRRSSSADPGTPTSAAASISPPSPPDKPATPSIRRPQRRFGLEVSAPKPSESPAVAAELTPEDRALAAEAEALKVVNRFTHQTGQVTDVDKHMMAYVELQMSKRRGEAAPSDATALLTTAAANSPEEAGKSSYWAPTRPEARGATLGKLHEVDLGEEVKQRNIALTAQALSGGGGGEMPGGSGSEVATSSKKSRRRRNSQDIERDRLVEEVLKETRLDLYPEEQDQEEGMDEEGAADDKIAEKFRKEFIDAILSKRRRRGADPKSKGNKKEDKKRPKGPKLGGSRMARAQMREQQGAASGSGARK
ncbi:hepatocellular carcinoma-associated antigen 59-domain-containing protein [Sphaerosporella brunnea]|uniref:Hepatocellular carcinoma-associated antigen 59-domain-containing protein n=1 Tax=Sphaerosporella brunnea TaxID=1250544 RepID=A0A5J5EGQ1_9PEZI|nr:hepatocellular carcinoma-associated antigen 59-domain-containing protein [Sphaerosporella brunnea]